MNVDLLEMNFKYNSFYKRMKPIYDKRGNNRLFFQYICDLVLNEAFFNKEIIELDLFFDKQHLKIYDRENLILDISEFIKDNFSKIEFNSNHFSILYQWFQTLDSQYILNNEQIFLMSLRFKMWNKLFIEEYLKFKPELKQISNHNTEQFDYFWTNICKYQRVDVNFIHKYIHIFLLKNKYCFLLKTNNNLFGCHSSVIRKIFQRADKYISNEQNDLSIDPKSK